VIDIEVLMRLECSSRSQRNGSRTTSNPLLSLIELLQRGYARNALPVELSAGQIDAARERLLAIVRDNITRSRMPAHQHICQRAGEFQEFIFIVNAPYAVAPT
jgi:hypothetical protein